MYFLHIGYRLNVSDVLHAANRSVQICSYAFHHNRPLLPNGPNYRCYSCLYLWNIRTLHHDPILVSKHADMSLRMHKQSRP